MKRIIIQIIGIITFLFAITIIYSDSKIQAKEEKTQNIENTNNKENKENKENKVNIKIQLNNGKKWQINKEMKPYIKKSQSILNDYVKNKKNNYKQLASKLEKEISDLIKSCTMTGKDHDALHLWLEPHLELIDELKNTTEKAKAGDIVNKLDNSFIIFNKYFR